MNIIANYSFFLLFLGVLIDIDANTLGRLQSPNKFQSDASTLIVGGRPAVQGEAPYQLSFRLNGRHYCGATLVKVGSLQISVTAAHCINFNAVLFELYAGDLDLSTGSQFQQIREVSHIEVHRNYSGSTLKNDIAILFFSVPFKLNNNVQQMLLPNQNQVTASGNLTVSGWGDLEHNGQSPDRLQIVEIPVVNDTFCQEAYQNYIVQATDDMICAGRPEGDISPCNGDSGGPAISDAGYLAGIVSWGHECGHPYYPAVFTKVSHYINWIETEVANYEGTL